MKLFKYFLSLVAISPVLIVLGLYVLKPADMRIFWDYLASDFDKPEIIISEQISDNFNEPYTYSINLDEDRYYEVGFIFNENTQKYRPKVSLGKIGFDIYCGQELILKETVDNYVYANYQAGDLDYLRKIVIARFPMGMFTVDDNCQLTIDMTRANKKALSDRAKLYYGLSNYL
ncbi:hypothetical protein [Kangiella shandongensis]|uniref:hypothetical protein n=1 Tax=Kangiella shandongensis TaxID=2763258 RepID=UPI001CBC227A|nr:hypothetical protein [Kangiella shandongensis]